MTSLVSVARRFSFIREVGGPNQGAFVEFIQWFAGGVVGESWCADFVSLVLFIAYRGKPPLAKTGSTRLMLADADRKGYARVDQPQPNDLYFFVHADGTPHHVGIVTSTSPLEGIAGNTSADGLSSDGTGVFEHAIPSDPISVVFIRLPQGGA